MILAPRLLLPAVSEYDSGGWKGAIRVFPAPRLLDLFVFFDFAVAQADDTVGVLRDVRFVGYQDDGVACADADVQRAP